MQAGRYSLIYVLPHFHVPRSLIPFLFLCATHSIKEFLRLGLKDSGMVMVIDSAFLTLQFSCLIDFCLVFSNEKILGGWRGDGIKEREVLLLTLGRW